MTSVQPGPSAPLRPARLPCPAVPTDGCRGLVPATQVSQVPGRALQPTATDGAGAAGQYAQSVASLGLTATVRVCPFGSPTGDQATVVALTFADAAQATKMFA